MTKMAKATKKANGTVKEDEKTDEVDVGDVPSNWDSSDKDSAEEVEDWEKLADSEPEEWELEQEDEKPPPPPDPVVLTAPIKQKKKKQALLKMADMGDSLCTDTYGAGGCAPAKNVEKVMESATEKKKKPQKKAAPKVKEEEVAEDWEDIDESHMDEKIARMQEVSGIPAEGDEDCRRDEKGRPIVMTIPKLLDYQDRNASIRPAELSSFRTAEVDQYGNIKPKFQPQLKRQNTQRRQYRQEPPLQTLHQSENAYRVASLLQSGDGTPDAVSREQRTREVKSILNKMSPEKFEQLTEKIASLEVQSPEDLELIIDLVFTKAVTEHSYCEMYSDLCVILVTRYPTFPPPEPGGVELNFVRVLLHRCQKEFEALPTTFDEVPDGVADPELYLSKQKERVLGNMKFIGQLFLRRMLSHKVVKEVVMELIFQTERPAEHLIECLCILLRNIGSQLESTAPGREHLASFIARMESLLNLDYSKRIKFTIEGVLELRNNKWNDPRAWKEKAKTKDEIRQDQMRDHRRTQGHETAERNQYIRSYSSTSASPKEKPKSLSAEIKEIIQTYSERRNAGYAAQEWRNLVESGQPNGRCNGHVSRGQFDSVEAVNAIVLIAYEDHRIAELVSALVAGLYRHGALDLSHLITAFKNNPCEDYMVDFPKVDQVYQLLVAAILTEDPPAGISFLRQLPRGGKNTFFTHWIGILRRIRDSKGIPCMKTVLQLSSEYILEVMGITKSPKKLEDMYKKAALYDDVEGAWAQLKTHFSEDDFSVETLSRVVSEKCASVTVATDVIWRDAFLIRLVGVAFQALSIHFAAIPWTERLQKVRPLLRHFTESRSHCVLALEGLVSALAIPDCVNVEKDLSIILRFFVDDDGLGLWNALVQWVKDPMDSSIKAVVVREGRSILSAA